MTTEQQTRDKLVDLLKQILDLHSTTNILPPSRIAQLQSLYLAERRRQVGTEVQV